METTTEPQLSVLLYIRECQKEGYTPTMVEISTVFGWRSQNSAHEHVRRLIKKGLLDRPLRSSNRLVITEAGKALLDKG